MDTNIEKLDNGEIAESEISVENKSAENEPEKVSAGKTAVPEKTEIVGVRFKKEGKTYYFAPNGFALKKDDKVIVDTSRGQEFGSVVVPNTMLKSTELVLPLRGVIRTATEEDTRIHAENLKKEIEAYNACIALIDEHNPKMKLIDVEYAFDRSKMLFYFSAEERVDFREIVKALATAFRTRIEMRQIGIRDEAKMLGGLGVCGRPFCCSAFLTDFVQVSVKMAKEQCISLNAAKISGACGKLMCCLRYEYDTYLEEKALTPKVGTRVMTPDGPGEVIEANPLAGIVKVRHDGKAEDSETTVYVREDVVKEEEYSGEKLTKTEIPKRGKSKEDDNVFGSFANVTQSATAAPAEPKKETEKQPEKPKPVQQEKVVEQGKKEEPQRTDGHSDAEETAESGNRNNRRRRKKHKGHGGGQNQGNAQSQGQSQNQGGQGNSQNHGGREQSQNRGSQQGQDRNQGGAQRQNGAPQGGHSQGKGHNPGAQGNAQGQSERKDKNGQNGAPQGGQNGQNNRGGHHKKKHFRPHHKKNDGSQGGANT